MHNLQELVNPGSEDGMQTRLAMLAAEEKEDTVDAVPERERVIIVANSLPLRMRHDPEGSGARGHSWHFEMDEDSIYGQVIPAPATRPRRHEPNPQRVTAGPPGVQPGSLKRP